MSFTAHLGLYFERKPLFFYRFVWCSVQNLAECRMQRVVDELTPASLPLSPQGCSPALPTSPREQRTLGSTLPPLPRSTAGGTTFYVDATKGKDANAGTEAAPFQSLLHARDVSSD